MDDRERTPLLTDENEPPGSSEAPPPYWNQQEAGPETSAGMAALPVETDELPPPYSAVVQQNPPVINCKVCQAIISLEGKQNLYVIKCSVCNEATPLRDAPPGKNYIRCTCNCLLVYRAGATKILCPRQTCKKVITLLGPNTAIIQPSHVNRYVCAYCQQVFQLQAFAKFARCAHCRRVSSVGSNYARTRGHAYLITGFILLAIAVGVTVGTFEAASVNGGIYIAWIGGFVLGLSFIGRSIYCYSIRTSPLVQANASA